LNGNLQNIISEISFKASRSGGKGGQNVNKVETKVELNFEINKSLYLTDNQKQILLEKLKNRIDKNGILKIVSQTERSQYLNKQKATDKLLKIISESLKKKKKRIATRPSELSKENRLQIKKIISNKKMNRSKPVIDD